MYCSAAEVGLLYGGDGEDHLSLWTDDSQNAYGSQGSQCAAAEAIALSHRLTGGREGEPVPYPMAMAELASGDLGDKDDASRLAKCFPTRAATAPERFSVICIVIHWYSMYE